MFTTAGEEIEVTITFGGKSDTFTVKVTEVAEKINGDVNRDSVVTITDGEIEILDAINIFRYLADKMTQMSCKHCMQRNRILTPTITKTGGGAA